MSSTRVKTTYAVQGAHGSTDYEALYCQHHHGSDTVTFYDANGEVQSMAFHEWENGNDLWDAMERLMNPFEAEWGGKLKHNVAYFIEKPSENNHLKVVYNADGSTLIPRLTTTKTN